ncbi:MAG: DNA-primase RepB domain-containing protein [Luteimonas sp.]
MTATRADAVRFLEALAPDGALTFSTFTNARPRPARDPLARILHGDYWRHAGALAKLNAKGAGVFVMVNRGDGNGRKAGNVQAVRAVFLDLDGAPLAPVLAAPIPPAIVCESSPGKHHAYWPIAGMPLGDFRSAQQALAMQYGGDAAVCDLPRVMRLPGYVHAKGQPFTSRLLHCDPVMPWQWPAFAETMALPFTARPAANKAEQWREGERNPTLYRFACGLRGQGLEQVEALRRMQVANAGRCRPPLDAGEVAGIVANAWQGETRGFVQLPHSLLDSAAFRALPHKAIVAILALRRQCYGANNGRLTLTRREAEAWGLNRYQRTDALEACEMADLIECTARGTSACKGHRATTDRFRLLFLP